MMRLPDGNFLRDFLLAGGTELQFFPVGICDGLGKMHDAGRPRAMRKPEAMPDFMHSLLDAPGTKQSVIPGAAVKFRPQTRQGDQRVTGAGICQAENKIKTLRVNVGINNPQDSLFLFTDRGARRKSAKNHPGIILPPFLVKGRIRHSVALFHLHICRKKTGEHLGQMLQALTVD